MNDELQAIKDAMDKETGRDYAGAVALADAYVAAHPELFTGLDQFDLPLLVELLSKRRNSGDDEGAWNVQAWILHRYAPQSIGGEYKAEVRLPNS